MRLAPLLPLALLLGAKGPGPYRRADFDKEVEPFGLTSVDARPAERRRPLAARLAAIEAERPSETQTTHEERRAAYVREEQSWVVQISGELVVRDGGPERRLVAPTNGLYLRVTTKMPRTIRSS